MIPSTCKCDLSIPDDATQDSCGCEMCAVTYKILLGRLGYQSSTNSC